MILGLIKYVVLFLCWSYLNLCRFKMWEETKTKKLFKKKNAFIRLWLYQNWNI